MPNKGGKPPALPAVPRLAGLTVPGIYECFALRTVQSSVRTTNPRAVIPAAHLGRNPALTVAYGSRALDPGLKPRIRHFRGRPCRGDVLDVQTSRECESSRCFLTALSGSWSARLPALPVVSDSRAIRSPENPWRKATQKCIMRDKLSHTR